MEKIKILIVEDGCRSSKRPHIIPKNGLNIRIFSDKKNLFLAESTYFDPFPLMEKIAKARDKIYVMNKGGYMISKIN